MRSLSPSVFLDPRIEVRFARFALICESVAMMYFSFSQAVGIDGRRARGGAHQRFRFCGLGERREKNSALGD